MDLDRAKEQGKVLKLICNFHQTENKKSRLKWFCDEYNLPSITNATRNQGGCLKVTQAAKPVVEQWPLEALQRFNKIFCPENLEENYKKTIRES